MKTKFWRLFWISDAKTNRCKKQLTVLTDVSVHVRQGRIIFCRQTLFRAAFHFKEHLSNRRTTCSPEPLSFKAKAGCQEVSVWSWLTFWTFLVLLSPNQYPCAVRNISIWCVVEEVSARSLQVTKGPRRAGDNARVASLKVTMAPHRLSNPLTEGPTWDHLGHQLRRTNMQTGTRTDMAPQRQLFQVRFLVLLITVVHWICTYMAVTFESFLWSVQWLMVLLIQKGKLQEFVFLLLLRNFTCESVSRLLCKVLSACLKVYDFFTHSDIYPGHFDRSLYTALHHCVGALCWFHLHLSFPLVAVFDKLCSIISYVS